MKIAVKHLEFLLCLLLEFGLLVSVAGCCYVVSTLSSTPLTTTETTTGVISSVSGGVISLSDGSSVSFPAGSLTADRTITVTKVGTDSLPDQVLAAVHVPTIES